MKRSTVIFGILLTTLVFGLFIDGCKSKEPKQRSKTLKGTVESVDMTNKIVTMNWFNEKIGRTIPVSGPIYKDTEIYIDGKIGDLRQIKEGDQVVVEGYQKGADTHPLKINIIRTPEQAQKIIRPTQSKPAK